MRGMVVVLLCVALGGCATREWIQTNHTCAQRAQMDIPPAYAQVWVEKYHSIEVPTGVTRCRPVGRGETECIQATRTEYIPYTALETVDQNAKARSAAIASCTSSTCIQTYGNPDCKPPRAVAEPARPMTATEGGRP